MRQPRAMLAALLIAASAFIAAAVELGISRERPARVAVMVDASPSTRAMWFRDAAKVRDVAARLAPHGELTFWTFADGAAQPLGDSIGERDARQTALPPLDADAVLLMSDGQLDASVANVPVFPIIEAEATGDARIISATYEDEQLLVQTHNEGEPRTLTWPDGSTTPVPSGSARLAHLVRTGGPIRISAGDRWPENDAVTMPPAPLAAAERWWIGSGAPAGFRTVDAAALTSADWLNAAVIVLNDVPADALPSDAQQAIASYVRDLSGSLLIVGGEHAFSAGGYGGTTLDALSPLASWPPTPRGEWFILIDASGSMASQAADGRAKVEHAFGAAGALALALPPSDSVAIGSFARDLRWWPALNPQRRVAAPLDLAASGPTNLRAAIASLIATRQSRSPARAIVLTDGEAELADVDELAAALRGARLTLDWLALAPRDADSPLARLVTATGGAVTDGGEPREWSRAAARSSRAAAARPMLPGPMEVSWSGIALNTLRVAGVNQTFAREGVAPLAVTNVAGEERIVAARWRVGAGEVASLAFSANAATAAHVAGSIARPPRDSRFTVRWLAERVIVDAAEAGGRMNRLQFELVTPGATRRTPLEQRAPGRYEAVLPPSSEASIVTLQLQGRVIDARAREGRSAPEFDAIGVDRDNLERIARRTGGRVLSTSDGPLTLPRPRRSAPLTLPLVAVGLAALAAALTLQLRGATDAER